MYYFNVKQYKRKEDTVMSVMSLNYEVSVDGILPATELFAGTQGDKMATTLWFTLSDSLTALVGKEGVYYRFDGYDAEGNSKSSDSLPLTSAELSFTLPEYITRYGGRICVYLVITETTEGEEGKKTEMELYSFPARMRLNFLPSSSGIAVGEYESYTTLVESAKSSAQKAQEAANRAIDAAEQLDGDNVYIFDGGNASGVQVDIYPAAVDELCDPLSDDTEERSKAALPITSGAVYNANKKLTEAVEDNIKAFEEFKKSILSSIYPIGSVVTFHDDKDHSYHLGFIWERIAQGRTLVGYDFGDADFSNIGNVGGKKEVTLTVKEMPEHNHSGLYWVSENTPLGLNSSGESAHSLNYFSGVKGNNWIYTGRSGGGQPHNNMPPYLVTSFWKRVS